MTFPELRIGAISLPRPPTLVGVPFRPSLRGPAVAGRAQARFDVPGALRVAGGGACHEALQISEPNI